MSADAPPLAKPAIGMVEYGGKAAQGHHRFRTMIELNSATALLSTAISLISVMIVIRFSNTAV